MAERRLNPVADTPAIDIPRVLLPDSATVFAARAQRLRDLASQQRGLAPFLALMAQIATAQQVTCIAVAAEGPPSRPGEGPPSRPDDAPPLVLAAPLPANWRPALNRLIEALGIAEGTVGECLAALRAMPPDGLDTQAAGILTGDPGALDRGSAALIAAALQAIRTAHAGRLTATPPMPDPDRPRCPVCGSAPIGSVLLAGGSTRGLRYLCCAFCSTRWNLPRIRCVHCGASGRIAYFSRDDAAGFVRAEACEDCRTYTKLLDSNPQPDLDPWADDLASLALDVMMAEAGYARFGLNPLMLPGP